MSVASFRVLLTGSLTIPNYFMLFKICYIGPLRVSVVCPINSQCIIILGIILLIDISNVSIHKENQQRVSGHCLSSIIVNVFMKILLLGQCLLSLTFITILQRSPTKLWASKVVRPNEKAKVWMLLMSLWITAGLYH